MTSILDPDYSTASNIRAVHAAVMTKPYEGHQQNPGRRVFNDLATVTSRAHAWLARAIEKQSLHLYATGAWLVGIGLALSLHFAEVGYTVLGLVHKDHKPEDNGSIGRLLFIWQQRRAAVETHRAQLLKESPLNTAPELGSIIPIPFVPLSSSSREKVRQSILAHCSNHDVHLHAVILTPVFSLPPFRGGPLGDRNVGSRKREEAMGYSFVHVIASDSESDSEEERPLDSDTSDEMVPKHGLHPLPSTKDEYAEVGEGSYTTLSLADHDVVQRAVQREVTEQLIVAQMFTDLLRAKPRSARGRVEPPSNKWNGRATRRPSPHPLSFLNPFPTFTGPTRGITQLPDFSEDWSSTDDEVEISRVHRAWSVGRLARSICAFITGFVFKKSTKADAAGGRLVLLSGCGESSFLFAEGVHAPLNAAREGMAKTLSSELGALGVHVSIVITGPLDQRASGLANTERRNPRRDPRTSATARTDKKVLQNQSRQVQRARFLARLSALWALDQDSCFWIVRQAVEARYPKRTYSLGLDVLVRRAMTSIPDSVWQLSSWLLYERLGGQRLESWVVNDEPWWFWTWMLTGPLVIVVNVLSACAMWIQGQ